MSDKVELASVDFDLYELSPDGVRKLLPQLCDALNKGLSRHDLRIAHFTQETPGGPIETLTVWRLPLNKSSV